MPACKNEAAYQGGLNVVKDFNHIKALGQKTVNPNKIFICYIDLH